MTKYTGHIVNTHANIVNVERFGYKDETFTESTILTIEIPGGITINTGKPITIHTGKPITITQENPSPSHRKRIPMPKTLADLTPAERAECVGMWADTPHGTGIIFSSKFSLTLVMLPATEQSYTGLHTEQSYTGLHNEFTPRFDLPRAWSPDGTPPAWDVETITTQPHPRGSWNANPEKPEYFDVPPGTTMHRWVGEWEPQP